jgi:hypothetical protein
MIDAKFSIKSSGHPVCVYREIIMVVPCGVTKSGKISALSEL